MKVLWKEVLNEEAMEDDQKSCVRGRLDMDLLELPKNVWNISKISL